MWSQRPPLLIVSMPTCGPLVPLFHFLPHRHWNLGLPLRPLPEKPALCGVFTPTLGGQEGRGLHLPHGGEGSGEQVQLQEPSFGGRQIWVHRGFFHPGILRQMITFPLWNGDSTLLARSLRIHEHLPPSRVRYTPSPPWEARASSCLLGDPMPTGPRESTPP